MYIDSVVGKYPEQLLFNRVIYEGNIVGLLWKNLDLMDDHKEIKTEWFITKDARLYFYILSEMYKQGYTVIDEIGLLTFLEDKPTVKSQFDERGGFKGINNLAVLLNKDNFMKYYDEIIKWNILLSLHDQGFNILKDIESFKKASSSQVYDHYDLMLNNLFIKKTLDTEVSDFKVGIEDYINEADKGLAMGYSYKNSLPLMNYITAGVTNGFHIVAGLSGTGKTSFVIYSYLLPLIEEGHNIILLCNEQTKQEWWATVLTTILSSKLNYFKINRKRFIQGHFTDEEREMIRQAIEWLRMQKGKICFVKMFNYNLSEVKMILKKYGKLGYDVAIYDTFKADTNDTSNPLWQTLLHSSKEIFQVSSKEGIRMICTVQIAQRFANTRYLNNSCLSGATAIIEVASSAVLLRNLWDDEKDPNSKFYVKPFNYKKGEDGKYSTSKSFKNLDENKKYMVAFISKNRSGDSDLEILLNNEPHINRFYEVGYCTVNRSQY